jgi:hypothetical protein
MTCGLDSKHGGSLRLHPHPANSLAIIAPSWHANLLQTMTTLPRSAILLLSFSLASVTLLSKQNLSSLGCVADAMLEKIPSRLLLHKLRVIHLIEADLNLSLGIL